MKTLAPLLCLVLLVAGCGSSDSTTTTALCKPGKLPTKQPGVLTIATGKPASPPYFKDNDPTNGKGFESAVAYAIADHLGYPEAKVEWIMEPSPSHRPGPKDFDFALNQIPISPEREKAVDFSAPYYAPSQAIVALKKTRWLEPDFVPSMEWVEMGAQKGSSSLEAIEEWIVPRENPAIFDRFGEVVTALVKEDVEAILLELPIALEVTAVRAPTAHVAAQFTPPGGKQWGAALEKDSPLTFCVSHAIEELRETGELEKITSRWMSKAIGVPIIT